MDSLMANTSTNSSMSNFSCLIGTVSDTNITDEEFWSIDEDLRPVVTSILAAVYIIFFLLAFIWNLFIIITYCIKFKLLKEPANFFLFNLAIADLLVSVTVMIFSFVAQAAAMFIFGYTDVQRCAVCDFAGFCIMFLVIMTFHLLAALSIDRFLLLAYPLRYKQLMKFWKALLISIAIWVISFIVAVLPLVGFGQYEFNRQFGSCIPRFSDINPRTGIPNFYYCIFVVVEALIPFGIIISTNSFTYRLVSKFLRRNIKRKRTFRVSEQTESHSDEDRKYKKQQKQLVRVFGALCVANCISWTPVIFVVLAVAVVSFTGMGAGFGAITMVPDGVFVFGWICYLTNPVVHPIIESFFVKDLRYQVKRARTTIRRASTAIIRTTTRTLFNSDVLDKAEQAADSELSNSTRKIKFFNSRKAKNNLRVKNTSMDMDATNATVDCDMDEMSSHSATPSPVPHVRAPRMNKRSVTFTETCNTSPTSEGGNLKSALKRHSEPAVSTSYIITEETEVGLEDQVEAVTTQPVANGNAPFQGLDFDSTEPDSPYVRARRDSRSLSRSPPSETTL